MTPKSEPAPISAERREEIERECTLIGGSGNGPNCFTADTARIAAYVDRQKAPLLERIQKLEGQRNGWATKRHASWCCGSGDSCCCGHEEAISGLTSKQVEAEMAEPDEMDRKVRGALEEACRAVCPHCAVRLPVYLEDSLLGHPNSTSCTGLICHAAPIRALLGKKVKP